MSVHYIGFVARDGASVVKWKMHLNACRCGDGIYEVYTRVGGDRGYFQLLIICKFLC